MRRSPSGFFQEETKSEIGNLKIARSLAASLGLEPRQRDPESLVLPLHYEAKVSDGDKT